MHGGFKHRQSRADAVAAAAAAAGGADSPPVQAPQATCAVCHQGELQWSPAHLS